jgi:predicted NBD/HSP70 family sugar kinase
VTRPYAQQRDARQQNASALLRDLWYSPRLSKAALAQRNNLTKATVSVICNDLAALNLIREVGQDKSGVGRPGNLLELNPAARAAIGVEISTNYVEALLVDFAGKPLWKHTLPVAPRSSQAAILSLGEALIIDATAQAKERELPLLGVGVSVPGAVDLDQCRVIDSPALGWRDVDLRDQWEERFRLPVRVDNRARAAALAESLGGAAKDVNNFLYVSIGTDVGASVDTALMINGELFRGAHGLGVDAGHLVLDPLGEVCSCGQQGCWQAMADVGREAPLARARLEAGEPSALQALVANDYADLEHRAIHQAALEGDPLAVNIARTVLLQNALGIANLVYLFDPELVVIGFASAVLLPAFQARMAAMMQAPDLDMIADVRRRLACRSLAAPAFRYATHGADVGALGGAMLLLNDFLRYPPVYEA